LYCTRVCAILHRLQTCFLLLFHGVPLLDGMRLSAGNCGSGGPGSHPDEGGKFGRVHVLAGVAFDCGEGHLPTWETEKRDDEWMFASFNGRLARWSVMSAVVNARDSDALVWQSYHRTAATPL